MRQFIVTFVTILLTTFAYAGFPVIEGQLTDSFGEPDKRDGVHFKVEIFAPGTSCLMSEETFNGGGGGFNLSATVGSFSLGLGDGNATFHGTNNDAVLPDGYAAVFGNNMSGEGKSSCVASVSAGSNRDIVVSYSLDGGATWNLISTAIKYTGAASAATLDGFGHQAFIKANTSGANVLNQANLEWVFSTLARYSELQALINGTSTQYMVSNPGGTVGFNGQVLGNIAAPAGANDATNKNYVDSKLGGQNVNGVVSAPSGTNDGHVLTWDGSANEYVLVSAPAAPGDDLGNHTATANIQLGANFISNNGIASEGLSFDGSNNANFSQQVTILQGLGVTTGVNSGGNVSVLGESEVRFEDNTGGEYISFKAPAVVSANTVLTLPDGDGSANQVLGTDGSGNLQWQTDSDAAAPVDTVFGRAGTVIAVAGDYTASEVTNVAAGDIAAVTVQAAINELDTEKLALAGGLMTGSINMDNEQEVRFEEATGNGDNFVAFKAPASLAGDQVFVLPGGDGSANQVLGTDGAGNLQWQTDNAGGGGDFMAAGSVSMTGALQLGGNNINNDGGAGEGLSFDAAGLATFSQTVNLATGADLNMGLNANIIAFDGSASAPSIKFAGAANTGLFGLPGNEIGFANNGAESVRINASGDVGIGVATPGAKLDVNGVISARNSVGSVSGAIKLYEASNNGAENIRLRAPASVGADYTLTLPIDDGSANQVLQTDGSGVLSWASVGPQAGESPSTGGTWNLVGNPGQVSSFFIRSVDEDNGGIGNTMLGSANFYSEAEALCNAYSHPKRGVAHMCSKRELFRACLIGASGGLADQPYVSADQENVGTHISIVKASGGGAAAQCTLTGQVVTSGSFSVRCCTE